MNRKRNYKCPYCHKIFCGVEDYNSHKPKCFIKPEAKSCMTCAYYSVEVIRTSSGDKRPHSICLNSVDISKSLKENCWFYGGNTDILHKSLSVLIEHSDELENYLSKNIWLMSDNQKFKSLIHKLEKKLTRV